MADLTIIKQAFLANQALLTALGDSKRQTIIVALLAATDCTGLRAEDLTEATGLSRPAVSHHLKLLKDAGLVTDHRVGTKNYYYFSHNVAAIAPLQQLLTEVHAVMERKPL